MQQPPSNKPLKFTLHLQAHKDIERFSSGILSSNKIATLLSRAREWKPLGDSKILIRFKWAIARNTDGVIIAQSKASPKQNRIVYSARNR